MVAHDFAETAADEEADVEKSFRLAAVAAAFGAGPSVSHGDPGCGVERVGQGLLVLRVRFRELASVAQEACVGVEDIRVLGFQANGLAKVFLR